MIQPHQHAIPSPHKRNARPRLGTTSQGTRATSSFRGLPAKLTDPRPCVAGRPARSPGSRTEDKMSSRRLSYNKRCPGTTWAVAQPADSRAHLFAASSRASWCRLPQTIAETRVPTVRRPSPRRQVAQPGPSRRTGAGQTMGTQYFHGVERMIPNNKASRQQPDTITRLNER